MDKLLKTYNLPRLNQEYIDNLNRLITSKESKWIIKNVPTMKSLEPDGFMDELYQTLKKNTSPFQTLSKNQKGGNTCKHNLWGQHYRDTTGVKRY